MAKVGLQLSIWICNIRILITITLLLPTPIDTVPYITPNFTDEKDEKYPQRDADEPAGEIRTMIMG